MYVKFEVELHNYVAERGMICDCDLFLGIQMGFGSTYKVRSKF